MSMVARALAGGLGGCTLALGVAGVYAQWGQGADDRNLSYGMLWVVPVWVAAFALVFIPASAKRACVGVILANALCYAALWLLAP
jgi:hypothetical protein